VIHRLIERLFHNKEVKTEARDRPAPAAKKLEDMIGMIRDPDARFSVSKTLQMLDDLDLSAEECRGKPGAQMAYIRGHIHALNGEWIAAAEAWDQAGADQLETLDAKARSTIHWGQTMKAYQEKDWDRALTGFNRRLAEETAKGKTGLMDTWALQNMRGWCFAHLQQLDNAETLSASLLDPGPSEDDKLYLYPEQLTEPLRFLSEARFKTGDAEGGLAALWSELTHPDLQVADVQRFAVRDFVKMAVNAQAWKQAHAAYNHMVAFTEKLEAGFVREQLEQELDELKLQRVGWPKPR